MSKRVGGWVGGRLRGEWRREWLREWGSECVGDCVDGWMGDYVGRGKRARAPVRQSRRPKKEEEKEKKKSQSTVVILSHLPRFKNQGRTQDRKKKKDTQDNRIYLWRVGGAAWQSRHSVKFERSVGYS